MLDSACMATPWLLTLGYMILYLSIFSKLYRINKVLQFRRRKVSTRAVAGPFFLLFVASIIVLSIWTAVDPYLWVRREVNAVTGETYGSCSSSNASGAVGVPLEYGIPLVAIAAIAAILTFAMAWKTKDIDEKFSESNWTFYALFLQCELMLVAIPILLLLGEASADASYLGKVLVIWSIPVSTMLLLIGPKAAKMFVPERQKRMHRGLSQGISVSGVDPFVSRSITPVSDHSHHSSGARPVGRASAGRNSDTSHGGRSSDNGNYRQRDDGLSNADQNARGSTTSSHRMSGTTSSTEPDDGGQDGESDSPFPYRRPSSPSESSRQQRSSTSARVSFEIPT